MKAKEKAKELVDMFYNIDSDSKIYDDFTMKIFYAQRCALICVDEILKNIPEEVMSYKPFMMNTDYWQEVKKEINKI